MECRMGTRERNRNVLGINPGESPGKWSG
jgi:hypothetical protein